MTTTTAKALGAPNQSAQLTAFRASPVTPTTAHSHLPSRYSHGDPRCADAVGTGSDHHDGPQDQQDGKAREDRPHQRARVTATTHLRPASPAGRAIRLQSHQPPPGGPRSSTPSRRPCSTATRCAWESVSWSALILGILATWLLDGLDRRLRTTKRAEEVFRLPVVGGDSGLDLQDHLGHPGGGHRRRPVLADLGGLPQAVRGHPHCSAGDMGEDGGGLGSRRPNSDPGTAPRRRRQLEPP